MTCVSPADYVNFQSWGGQSGHRLEVMPQSKFSGVSGCSDAAVSQGSVCGTPTPDDIVMGETSSRYWLSFTPKHLTSQTWWHVVAHFSGSVKDHVRRMGGSSER